jgi:hypothetical protein
MKPDERLQKTYVVCNTENDSNIAESLYKKFGWKKNKYSLPYCKHESSILEAYSGGFYLFTNTLFSDSKQITIKELRGMKPKKDNNPESRKSEQITKNLERQIAYLEGYNDGTNDCYKRIKDLLS